MECNAARYLWVCVACRIQLMTEKDMARYITQELDASFLNLVMGTNTTDLSGHINYATPQTRRKTFIYSDFSSTVYCFPERQLQWQS